MKIRKRNILIFPPSFSKNTSQIVFLMIGISIGYFCSDFINPHWNSSNEPSKINVCFTPGGKCTDLIVREINKAKKFIRVHAYSFTSAPITQTLIEAHKRGVSVEVLMDRSQQKDPYSAFNLLKRNGIVVKIDRVPGIAHNKVVVIDGTSIISGSFNFTRAAENRNAENVVLINDPQIAQYYMANWVRRWTLDKNNLS